MENNIIIEEKAFKAAYAYWLHNALERNNKYIGILLREIGDPYTIYHTSEEKLAYYLTESQLKKYQELKSKWNVEKAYERLQQEEIKFYTYDDMEYPDKLKEIPDAPYGIYVKGQLPNPTQKSVAVIGARNCSAYGRYLARECGLALARNGFQVISGMARGIDGISQKGALDAGGDTYAVLGSGVDICYPESNRELYQRIMNQGGIISEYHPGLVALPRNFPPRNRIISGLSDAVLVIEAREKSGTLITVDMALEQGREVYVIPGRITDVLSGGCNRLIRQGAEMVLSIEEFIAELRENNLVEQGSMEQLDCSRILSEQVESEVGKLLIETMDFTPQSLDIIIEKMRTTMTERGKTEPLFLPDVLQELVQLQMRKMVLQKGGQYCLCM